MAINEQYRKLVQDLLTRYSIGWDSTHEIESQLLFDVERGHFQWMRIGWKGSERIYHSIIHFDIKGDQIWLQQNMTDQDPAAELVELGVSQEDIILGLQPPFKRPYTDYGAA
jgi:XisI protein